MGFFRKLTGADAAKDAAEIQAASGDKAIDQLREELGIARTDLQPFVDVGAPALGDLRGFNTFEAQEAFAQNDPAFQNVRNFEARPVDFDPSAALSPVLNFQRTPGNPLYDRAVNEAMRRTEERRASMGKLDSGGTEVDLVNATTGAAIDSLNTLDRLDNSEFSRRLQTAGITMDANRLDVGVDQQENDTEFNRLIQEAGLKSGLTTDQFNRLLAVTNLSQASAAGQASNQQALGSQVAGITQGIGNAQAAGVVGAANANRSFWMDIAKLAQGNAENVAKVLSGGMA